MKAIYIASPFAIGDPMVNVREGFLIADQLAGLGFLPYPPLYALFWNFLSPHPKDFWIRFDLEWILRCDALLRLPGESKGADNEVAYAKEHGIPVYYSIEELLDAQKSV